MPIWRPVIYYFIDIPIFIKQFHYAFIYWLNSRVGMNPFKFIPYV